MSRPRFIKSHLPTFLLPDELWIVKPKIIYVARNPLDLAVSYFHHHRHIHKCKGDIDDFLEALISNEIIHTPLHEHVLDFWKMRDQKNLLFIFYEDMKRDFDGEVKKLANFLGKSFTQEQIDMTCDYLSFDKMKKNPKLNFKEQSEDLKVLKEDSNEFKFLRKGKIGSYKEELNEKQIDKLKKYSKHPDFEKYNFEYKY